MHTRTRARDRIFSQKTYRSAKRRAVLKRVNSISIIAPRDKNKKLSGNFFADYHQQYPRRKLSLHFRSELRRRARQKCNLLYFNKIAIRMKSFSKIEPKNTKLLPTASAIKKEENLP